LFPEISSKWSGLPDNSLPLGYYSSQKETPKKLLSFAKLRLKILYAESIDVAVPIEALRDINSILEQVNFLSFITLPKKDPLPRGSLSKLILHVLTSTSKLTHFQIDVRLMHRKLDKAFACPAVQLHLKNLYSRVFKFYSSRKNKNNLNAQATLTMSAHLNTISTSPPLGSSITTTLETLQMKTTLAWSIPTIGLFHRTFSFWRPPDSN